MSTNSSNGNKFTMTPQQLQTAVAEVIKRTRPRLKQRVDEIVKIINKNARQNEKFGRWIDFVIKDLDEMIENVLNTLRYWKGGKYDKNVKTDKLSFDKTRNFWCREKSKPISDSMIYPILCQLFQHINQFDNTSPGDKVLLYIFIIYSLLQSEIKFTRTSAKPLILHSMFLKNNKFKKLCKKILQFFNLNESNDDCVEWGSVKVTRSVKQDNNNKATSQYIRDDHRAKHLHDTFVGHLIDIESQISKCQDTNKIQHRINGFMEWMGIKRNDKVKDNNDMDDNKHIDVDNTSNNNHHHHHHFMPPVATQIIPMHHYNNNNNNYNHIICPVHRNYTMHPAFIPIARNSNNRRRFQSMGRFCNGLRINLPIFPRENGREQRRELHIQQMRYTPNNGGHPVNNTQNRPIVPNNNRYFGFNNGQNGLIDNNYSVPTVSTATPPHRPQQSIPSISTIPSIPTIPMTATNYNNNQMEPFMNQERVTSFRNDNNFLVEQQQPIFPNNELDELDELNGFTFDIDDEFTNPFTNGFDNGFDNEFDSQFGGI